MTTQDMTALSNQVINLMPQKKPFLFIDRITAIDSEGITAEYYFDPSLDFYRGHFPGHPVTPGVILIEAMAQTGVVAHGVWHMLMENEKNPESVIGATTSLFTETHAEFLKTVPPGSRVKIVGKKEYFRRGKIKANATVFLEDGTIAATATLCGMGVKL
jgi:3-hydroxyacyl-[acyl-carrier-protein] dehydratase